jgi:hypothetical protein
MKVEFEANLSELRFKGVNVLDNIHIGKTVGF